VVRRASASTFPHPACRAFRMPACQLHEDAVRPQPQQGRRTAAKLHWPAAWVRLARTPPPPPPTHLDVGALIGVAGLAEEAPPHHVGSVQQVQQRVGVLAQGGSEHNHLRAGGCC
jgi:hypothetical protein